jgi:predicted RNase H-like HicB family nuclease
VTSVRQPLLMLAIYDVEVLGSRIVAMNDFTVDVEREDDGRWIGEVPQLAGVLTYGASRDEAIAKAKALALRVLADRLEHGEAIRL